MPSGEFKPPVVIGDEGDGMPELENSVTLLLDVPAIQALPNSSMAIAKEAVASPPPV